MLKKPTYFLLVMCYLVTLLCACNPTTVVTVYPEPVYLGENGNLYQSSHVYQIDWMYAGQSYQRVLIMTEEKEYTPEVIMEHLTRIVQYNTGNEDLTLDDVEHTITRLVNTN